MLESDTYYELLKKLRTIDIITSSRVTGQQAGVHISLFKGQGIEFSDIREYLPGDDIRAIDWKITARYCIPYIKEFVEERDHTVYIIFDHSGSGSFGQVVSKFNAMITVLATVLFSAVRYHDRAGLVLVTDKVERYFPARCGRTHAIYAINSVTTHKPASKGSDLRPAIKFLLERVHRMATVLIISDFLIPDCFNELTMLKRYHDILAVRIVDKIERELPDVGLIELEDAETGEQILVDTSNPDIRERYRDAVLEHELKINQMFRRIKIPFRTLNSDEECYRPLSSLFSTRLGRVL